MKTIVFFVLIWTNMAWSAQNADCELNDSSYVSDVSLITLVDFFSVNNARTLSLKYNGEEIRFGRKELVINGEIPRLTFIPKKEHAVVKMAQIIIDRSPNDVLLTGEFKATLHLTENSRSSKFDMYCSFNNH